MNKQRVVSVMISLSMLFGFASVSPVMSAGSAVHLDATGLGLSNGDTVTTWGGQIAGGTPTYLTGQTPNGGPVVEFDGGDRMGDNIFVPSSSAGDWILVVVIKPANIGAYHNLVDDDASTRPMLWIDPSYNYELNYGGGTGAKAAGAGPDGWDIVIADSRLNQLYVNSSTANATGRNAVAFTTGKPFDFFHRDGGQTFRGQVAELRIYTDRADFGGDFAALYGEMHAKWIAQTPTEQINALITTINSFNLNGGTANSLTSKLDNTAKSLGKNNANAACGQVDAFINQVNALSGNQLTAAQAAELLASANQLKTSVGCA